MERIDPTCSEGVDILNLIFFVAPGSDLDLKVSHMGNGRRYGIQDLRIHQCRQQKVRGHTGTSPRNLN